MDQRLIVHDPRGYPPKVNARRLAPRQDTLDGKLVYLVDCLFDNSDAFMDQMQQWFAEHRPSVRTQIIRPGTAVREFTPSKGWADDPEMFATIGADGDGAIIGVGL
jgi:hypothetical protein